MFKLARGRPVAAAFKAATVSYISEFDRVALVLCD